MRLQFDGAIALRNVVRIVDKYNTVDAEVAGDTCRDRCATTTDTEGSFARDSAYLI
jgi:hypothetical protein